MKELLAIQETEDKDKELEKLRKKHASIKEAKRKAMEIAKKAEEKAALEAQARIDAEQKATLEAQARIDAEAENAKLKAILEQYQQKFDQVT